AIAAVRAAYALVASRHHALASRALTDRRGLEAGGDAALDRKRFIHMIYTVDTWRPMRTIAIVVVHPHASREREIVGQVVIIFDEQGIVIQRDLVSIGGVVRETGLVLDTTQFRPQELAAESQR